MIRVLILFAVFGLSACVNSTGGYYSTNDSDRTEWGNPAAIPGHPDSQLPSSQPRNSRIGNPENNLRFLGTGARFRIVSERRPTRRDTSHIRCRNGSQPQVYRDQRRLEVGLICL